MAVLNEENMQEVTRITGDGQLSFPPELLAPAAETAATTAYTEPFSIHTIVKDLEAILGMLGGGDRTGAHATNKGKNSR